MSHLIVRVSDARHPFWIGDKAIKVTHGVQSIQRSETDEHIAKIIATYQSRKEQARYSRRVQMDEIAKNDFNLNVSRYILTAVGEDEIDLLGTHAELLRI
jgi:type I restriction-modification system DNA methylase subunit